MGGGESSGGLTVRGHIEGKDGIYAAALLVEIIAVTGKELSELYKEITDTYGMLYTEGLNFIMTRKRKAELMVKLFEEEALPEFPVELTSGIEKIMRFDGCKVYFKNGGWIIARFSGTEPSIRLCCEMSDKGAALEIARIFKEFLGL